MSDKLYLAIAMMLQKARKDVLDNSDPLNDPRLYDTQGDPRDPDYSRKGVFIDHNCWRCDSGAKPCIKSNPRDCETLHARND